MNSPTVDQSGFKSYRQQLSSEGPHAPFASKLDWEVARWVKLQGPSSSAVTDFFQIEGVVARLGLSYSNAREINMIIDQKLPARPLFSRQNISIGNETVFLYSRDVLQCIRAIYGSPQFATSLLHKPERHYQRVGNKRIRVFHEMHTGSWWWNVQMVLEAHKPGASIVPIIISSDRTQVTVFGSRTAYPVYLTIGNLPKHIRKKPSCAGQILLAYLPTTKLKLVTGQTSRRRMIMNLFHSCLRRILAPLVDPGLHGVAMTDGQGTIRRVHPLLAVFAGDYPEQVLVTCIKSGECPKCDISRNNIGNAQIQSKPRDIQAIHTVLSMVGTNYQDYKEACKKICIKPVAEPFWAQLPFIDIFQAITPDILHQLHQGLFKHVVSWLGQAYGRPEIDARCQRLIPNHHIRIFSGGITGLTRVTGKEHALISRIILGVIADMRPLSGLDPTRLLRMVRALLDFMYIAQLPVISTQNLILMRTALDTFHANKSIFVDLGIRDNFNIPKLHACLHYAASIRLFGTTDNYNTQSTERLHIDFTKEAFRASNMRDEFPQMTTWLERREKVHEYDEYIRWQEQGNSYQPPPSRSPLLQPRRHIKMTRYPSVRAVSIADLIGQYGASFFRAAFSRFIVLWRDPQTTRARLEQDILDVHIPFTSVSVYHRIRFKDDHSDESTADSIHIQPHRNNKRGEMIPGRFDTALICLSNGTQAGIHVYCVAQIRVIFSLSPIAIQHLFGERNRPPQHLAYVEWFTSFRDKPEPKSGLYRVSRSLQQNARVASIIPVTHISQSIHLTPLPGSQIPQEWSSNTVLEQCHNFLVNPFTDARTYTLFYGPK
ncbi:hypothetical protein F5887DRAFT_898748 [Amanita rubescens]|nr:hypothetical protein F5887DRAFT_898748 [Amanita rubescens]